MPFHRTPSSDVYPVASGYQWRAYRDDGTTRGGWAFREETAAERAQEALTDDE